MKKFLLFFVMITLPLLAKAYDVKIDGIYYNLIKKAGIAEVTYGADLEGWSYFKNNRYDYEGDIVIPARIVYEDTEYVVTAIGSMAFQRCVNIISVTLPSTIKTIKAQAFQYCSLQEIVFPEGVETISTHAFSPGTNLSSVTFPSTINTIEDYAFEQCPNLKKINIASIESWLNISIGSNSFPDERHLFCENSEVVNITIPQSVQEIKDRAFMGCVSIQSVTFHDNIISIGGYAFWNCSSIKSLCLPESITSIGDCAFAGCSSLETANIPSNITSLGGVFASCKSLTGIRIPNNVKKIERTFMYCSSLTSIEIPNSLEEVGNTAFQYCSNLKEVIIGNGIKKIKWLAFANCEELSHVYCYSLNVPQTDMTSFSNSYPEYITLHVPASSVEEYKNIEPWNHFKEIVAIKAQEYTLMYVVDGEEYKSYQIEEGEAIIPEPTPIKEGYTFSGWSEIPKTMPAHDVTVTGSFSINKYKLTYTIDGEEYKTYEVEYGATITPEAEPTKEGYTFSGWSEIPETMPAHDLTVTGTFTINKYKLTYIVDGAEYKTYEVEYGATITPEAEPTKEGYTFSGWSEIPKTMPAHDVTVTGTFTKGAYKLTYYVDGVVYKTVSYDYGTTITPEAEPTKEGYTFSGWSEIPETMPAHDVTVTGTFTKGAYKLTYYVDGVVYKTVSYDYGTTITPEAEPTKEGYTFSGWSEIPETMPAHDVTVTGTFTINKYKLTYIVDGAEYKTYEIEYNATITAEAEPTKEGYTFSGWSKIPSTMPPYDVTVTGTFNINSYKLTYMIDDKVYKEMMYEYGATIIPESQPEGDYQTFEWTDLPQTMPAHDVVVHASYTSGIIEVLMTSRQNVRIYSPNGKKLNKLQKGLNIVIFDDGTVKKIIMK